MRDWLDDTTLIIAVIGAGLGLYNSVQARRQNTTLLQITPGVATIPGEPMYCFSVEIVNQSAFPVTIKEIALTAEKGTTRFFFHPPYFDGTVLPVVLEARSTRSFVINRLSEQRKTMARSRKLMVRTGDEKIFKVATPLLKNLIRKAKEEESLS